MGIFDMLGNMGDLEQMGKQFTDFIASSTRALEIIQNQNAEIIARLNALEEKGDA